jgi:hypothetical protein
MAFILRRPAAILPFDRMDTQQAASIRSSAGELAHILLALR